MSPEQIEKARQLHMEWYRKNKDKVREYTREKYNNDFDYWKRTTDYQRERYKASRPTAIKLKPGRKPRSTSNSSDEAASPSPPTIKCRGRPRLHEVDENKEKKPPGRPIKRKAVSMPSAAI